MGGQSVDLFRLQSSVTEHADLLLDMRPVSGSLVLVLQEIVESFSHGDDSVGHALDLDLPVLVEFGRVENLSGETGSAVRGEGERKSKKGRKRDLLDGRVRVHRPDQDLELTVDSSLFVLVGANQTERANSFTVETHVLGETLAQGNRESLFNKVSNGEGIVFENTRCEALVGHVKECKVVLLLEDLTQLDPLVLGQIGTEGVECRSVEEESGSVGGGLNDELEENEETL